MIFVKRKKYYILEIRYKKNGFLLDEVEYYNTQKRAIKGCNELSGDFETAEEIIMVNRPFVGKGEISFKPEEIYCTVSRLREPMMPEGI